jgi:large subunit ribosomal protein L32
MAAPKKKVSRSRRNMRRFAAGNQLDKTQTMTCPSCSEPTRPHRICACGFYAGKQVLPAKKKKTELAQA